MRFLKERGYKVPSYEKYEYKEHRIDQTGQTRKERQRQRKARKRKKEASEWIYGVVAGIVIVFIWLYVEFLL